MSLTRPWPAIWYSTLTPPVSGMTPYLISGSMNRAPSAAMRMSHRRARWNEPPMAQPWIGTITGTSRSQSCWMPRMTAGHELVVGELDLAAADGAHVSPRRPGRALTPPDHRPHVVTLTELAEDLEQAGVHLVVERVLLVGVVVGDDGDHAVDVQSDPLVAHRGAPICGRAPLIAARPRPRSSTCPRTGGTGSRDRSVRPAPATSRCAVGSWRPNLVPWQRTLGWARSAARR